MKNIRDHVTGKMVRLPRKMKKALSREEKPVMSIHRVGNGNIYMFSATLRDWFRY